MEERQVKTVSECLPFNPQIPVTWLECGWQPPGGGPRRNWQPSGYSSLVLEDILDTSQRPKMEDFDQYLFIELNMLLWDEDHATNRG